MYILKVLQNGDSHSYEFDTEDKAVLAFYGKVVETRMRNYDFVVMDLRYKGKELINFVFDKNTNRVQDLRPTCL